MVGLPVWTEVASAIRTRTAVGHLCFNPATNRWRCLSMSPQCAAAAAFSIACSSICVSSARTFFNRVSALSFCTRAAIRVSKSKAALRYSLIRFSRVLSVFQVALRGNGQSPNQGINSHLRNHPDSQFSGRNIGLSAHESHLAMLASNSAIWTAERENVGRRDNLWCLADANPFDIFAKHPHLNPSIRRLCCSATLRNFEFHVSAKSNPTKSVNRIETEASQYRYSICW